jgi:hypothetical protein
MTQLYVVEGRTGEYADKQQWLVGATADQSVADALVEKLNNVARRFNARMGECDERLGLRTPALIDALREAGDKSCDVDYTGVEYRRLDVPALS